jgi:hypothetical protein
MRTVRQRTKQISQQLEVIVEPWLDDHHAVPHVVGEMPIDCLTDDYGGKRVGLAEHTSTDDEPRTSRRSELREPA